MLKVCICTPTFWVSSKEIKDTMQQLFGFQSNLRTQIWIASTTPDDLLQKLWVQYFPLHQPNDTPAPFLNRFGCTRLAKIMDPLRNLDLTGNLALVPITWTHITFTFMLYYRSEMHKWVATLVGCSELWDIHERITCCFNLWRKKAIWMWILWLFSKRYHKSTHYLNLWRK